MLLGYKDLWGRGMRENCHCLNGSFSSVPGFCFSLKLFICAYLSHMSVNANVHHSRDISLFEKSYFRCKKNTWHVKCNYMLQPSKYLIIVVNRFRYINNNFTKDRCSIHMDMTVVFGIHKFSLQATINRHGPSMYSGHYTASISCCKNILL